MLLEGGQKLKLAISQRILLLVVGVSMFVGAFVALYLVNPKQNGFVATGVQGRYLIPSLLCVLLAIQGVIPFNVNISQNKILVFLLFLILFIALLTTQMTILDRYYE